MKIKIFFFTIAFLSLNTFAAGPSKPKGALSFPDGFKWCLATAAHQIEGNNHNSDWWDFEKTSGRIKDGSHSGMATDHWNRVDEDVGLIKNLSANTYRMSVEWAKIEPIQGQWDHAAMEHYVNEIAQLRRAGIEPIITLHHFTFPNWVRKKGGWEWDGVQKAFVRFTRFVYESLGHDVELWVTINEPMVHLLVGYTIGLAPPGEQRPIPKLMKPLVGLLKGHAAAYKELHSLAKQARRKVRVGIAHHQRVFEPYHWYNPMDVSVTKSIEDVWNQSVMRAIETGRLNISIPFVVDFNRNMSEIRGTQDWIGINYYTRDFIQFNLARGFDVLTKPEFPKSDLGWEIYPQGIYDVIMDAHLKYRKPIIITENGLADHKDEKRKKFLKDHLTYVLRALHHGAKVEGYCHWSLLDNFEWSEGFIPRFGFYEVNYKTFERTLRPSGIHFEKIARENKIVHE